MTKGPIRLDVSVGYAVPRAGLPAAVSFRKWVAAALAGRIREADLADPHRRHRRKAARSTAITAARTTPPTC